MSEALRREVTRDYGVGRKPLADLAKKTGLCIRLLYNVTEGKAISLASYLTLLRHLRPAAQSRVMAADAGLLVEPMTSEGYTLGEAAAGVAGWNMDYCEAMADGRVDHQERRRLMDRAHQLWQRLGGMIRHARRNK